MRRLVLAAAFAISCVAPVFAQQVKVEEFTLDNGMKFLLVPRHEEPNIIAAGWVAKVGSANERPGITGISHFFEHMMFKGTDTIGTKDPVKDAEFRATQTRLRGEILKLTFGEQYTRWKAGEIDDPWDPVNDSPRLKELRAELNQSMQDQKAVTKQNEFDQVYTNLGASGMNAFTSYDMTFYFINVPANKFELWAWMESDRLLGSTFREFYAERDVVHEERRMRTESTPTGIYQEQFDSIFWQSHPYHWPIIGWTSDLNSYTMEQAQDYFNIYYRPNNLIGVIVGDFDPAAVKPMIESYFGRLERGSVEPPAVSTLEMPQLAESRMNAECDCQPQVEVRYHTVPFNHKDSFALEMMANVLNGRTGRLYKAMVEGKKIASNAGASQSTAEFAAPAKYAGAFSYSAEVKGDATPQQLEEGWYEELAKLQKELVPDNELQKVKNQVAANSYRRLQSNFFLMVQLGIFELMGDWEYINQSSGKLQAVTAEDIQRVANTYFAKTNRAVATYTRKAGSGGEDTEFLALQEKIGPQMANQIKAQVKQMQSIKDVAILQKILQDAGANKDRVPAEMKAGFDYMIKQLEAHLASLQGDAPAAQ